MWQFDLWPWKVNQARAPSLPMCVPKSRHKWSIPADTWRNNGVIMTSQLDVVITSCVRWGGKYNWGDESYLSWHTLWCPWWRHQMKTFSALLALCAGNSPVTGEFPSQRPVTRSFDVLIDLHLNKHLSKQSWCWWFETPLCPLWRHCSAMLAIEVLVFRHPISLWPISLWLTWLN